MTKEELEIADGLFKIDVEAKRAELEVIHKRPVHSFIFVPKEGDYIVGYIKEPERITKLRVIDMYHEGQTTGAGEAVLKTCLLTEESDKRILSEAIENDSAYIGAVMKCNEIVKFYVDQIKKK